MITVQHEDALAAVLDESVKARALAGAATLIWHDGKICVTCAGWRDVEAKLPMERDSLFRIASLTKPITSVAALMLLEEGRFSLDDAITRWAPEFSEMRVLRSPCAPLNQTNPAERSITFEDLLTHRSGLIYGPFHNGPLGKAYEETLGGDIDSHIAPDEWIARLAALPLIDQPGNLFHYGRSTDLLGLLIARMEDMPLGEVLRRRIFDPLGMKDTGFTVPADRIARRAGLYGFDSAGGLTKVLTCPAGATVAERPDDMAYVSGGQGLWSTLDDYLVFARIFLGEGSVEGVKLLRPETYKLLVSNRLTETQRTNSRTMRMSIFSEGHGFGLGVAVVLDANRAPIRPCGGSAGSVGWPGAFGAWWRADRVANSVMIFLSHNMVEIRQLASGIGGGAYRTIAKFQALASASASAPAA
jgi:CubicO group peptidase (beta-lactamase class C family)